MLNYLLQFDTDFRQLRLFGEQLQNVCYNCRFALPNRTWLLCCPSL